MVSNKKNKFLSSAPLADDILIEILSRLPVKYILQCKTVCKTWLNLITDDGFVKTHLLRATQMADPVAVSAYGFRDLDKRVIFLSFKSGVGEECEYDSAHESIPVGCDANNLNVDSVPEYIPVGCGDDDHDENAHRNNPDSTHENLPIVTTHRRAAAMMCPLKPLVKVTCPFTTGYVHNIVDSCNGLLLCFQELDFMMPAEGKLYIWNPFLGEFKMLPTDPPIERPKDGNLHEVDFGFWYDCANDDYKVLKTIYFFNWQLDGQEPVPSYAEVRVYTLGTNSWRRTQIKALYFPNIRLTRTPKGGVFVNGALHWITTVSTSLAGKIISFDVRKEEYIEIEKPNSIDISFEENGKYFPTKLHVLGGYLTIFHYNKSEDYVEAWAMKEYGLKDSWTKLFTIVKPIHALGGEGYIDFRPLKCCENGEILMILAEAEVILYNPEKDNTRLVRRPEKGVTGRFLSFDPVTHIETLVSPLKLVKRMHRCSHDESVKL